MTAARLDPQSQELLRELAPAVLGAVVRRVGDFAAAEDAVQEALLAAALQWPRDGIPHEPRAWLVRVAARRITDEVRAAVARRRRETFVVSLVPADEQFALAADDEGERDAREERDDTLDLFFMCCHPVLSPASAIALTLRAVGGLTTFEISRAFMMPEATVAQRISRAKQSIKDSGVPFARPTPGERAARLGAVMHVLYLLFSEGYTASSGTELVRSDLAVEALRLARTLRSLVPDDAEVAGLVALMLLTDARRAARTGPAGELVPLDRQDRALWDRAAIEEGVALISATLARRAEQGVAAPPAGPYQLQAAIAALHDEAPSTEATDWPQILALYAALYAQDDNPMVALSHAIALAMVHGPAAGLARLDALAREGRLEGHHRLDAVRAHLLERAGEHRAAIEHYRRAAARTASVAERDYLLTHAARLAEADAFPEGPRTR